MPSPALQTTHLRKEFGDKTAVEDLTLTVERGEVFGFLGPNGAGKTTSVKMLLGLVHPTSGAATVLGRPLGDPAIRAKVGFLPEHFRFHNWLTGAEFLKLHSELYCMTRADARQRIPELLDLVGLTPHAGKRLGGYSKGMLQRIGLAQALLNRPDLVFLDEPTSGLDPFGRRLVRDVIREQRKQGTAIFLNSHLLSEIEVTCDRVAFIKHGQVIRAASLKELSDGEVSVEIRADRLTPDIIAGLHPLCRHINTEHEHLSLTLADESQIPAINRYLVEKGVDVFAIRPQNLSLEDLFVQIMEKDEGF
jgi:ABC-2 type transport system ATP-binding protein